MATIGWIKVGLSADSSALIAGLDRGKAAIGSFTSAVTVAKGVLGGLGVAMGLGKAVEGFKAMISSASDLNENINKVQAVFGEGSKVVIDSADQMARSFGTSRNEFLDFAGRMGGLFKGAGFAAQETSNLSVRFTRLAADASSFFNVPFDQAFMKIRSGLAGESEPLRDFGVFLTEDTVKSYAYSHGLAKVGEELSQTAKIQARAALITQGLADAQGDLARTSGGVANLARNAWGQLENLGAALGQAFLPVAQQALSAAASFLGAMTDWVQSSGVIQTIGSLIDSVILTPIEFLIGLVRLANDAFHAMGINLVEVFTAALTPIAELVKAIASILKWLTYGRKEAEAVVQQAAKAPAFKQVKQPEKLAAKAKAHDEVKFAAAAQLGSREAYSAIIRSRAAFTAGDSQRQIARDSRITAENSARQVETLKRIQELLTRGAEMAPALAHL
jgi:hypothetical protein